MQLVLLSLLVTVFAAQAFCENEEEYPTSNSTDENPPNYDYVVKLLYNIEESRVPQYIISIIYNQAAENRVRTEDIINLFNVGGWNLETTKTVLQELGKEPNDLLSISGLDKTLNFVNVSFKDYYNAVKTNLTLGGKPLRDALKSLGINSGDFSDGLAYGDPEPYYVFKRGTFTEESIKNACDILSITVEDLFRGAKNVALNIAIENLDAKIFMKHVKQVLGIDEENALKIWSVLNLTVRNVYNVEIFRNHLSEINNSLEKILTLGVHTGDNQITVNQRTFELWKNKLTLISVFAKTIKSGAELRFVQSSEDIYPNIVVLKLIDSNKELPVINIGQTKQNLTNCTYVTFVNGTLSELLIEKAVYRTNSFEIPRGNITDLIVGSPLICGNKVYGLARDLMRESESIILDAYSSGSIHRSYIYLVVFVTLLLPKLL